MQFYDLVVSNSTQGHLLICFFKLSHRLLEGLIEVLLEVRNVLQSHGKTDQAVRDAKASAFLSRNAGVRHEGRQLAETLIAAETLSQGEDLDSLEEPPCHLHIIPLDVDGHHAGVAVALAQRELVLGVGGQGGVQHLLHGGWPSRNLAIWRPFSPCAFMRCARVLRDRSTR